MRKARESGELPNYPGGKLAFSPDARLLAAAGERLAVWDVAERKEFDRFTGADGPFDLVAFSHDGQIMAGVTRDPIGIILWDVQTGALRRRLGDAPQPAWSDELEGWGDRSVSFSPDSSKIVVAEPRKASMRVAATGEALAEQQSEHGAVTFDEQGRPMTLEGNSVVTWDATFSSKLTTLPLDGFSLPDGWDVQFSPGGAFVVAMQVWDVSGEGGGKSYTSSKDTNIQFWDTRTAKQVFSIADQGHGYRDLAMASDAAVVATLKTQPWFLSDILEEPNVVTVWRTDRGRKLNEWRLADSSGPALLTPDGRWLLQPGKSDSDGRVQITFWHCTSAGKLSERSLDGAVVRALNATRGLVFTTHGRSGPLAGESGSLVDLRTGRSLAHLPASSSQQYHKVAFSADGNYLAIGMGRYVQRVRGVVEVWDLRAIHAREQFRIGDSLIDWTKAEARSKPKPEVTIAPPNGAVNPASPVEIQVQVRNAGRGSLHRLYCRTSRSEPAFDGKPLIFGRIQPGKSMTRVLSLATTADVKPGLYRVMFRFDEANGNAPAPATTDVEIGRP